MMKNSRLAARFGTLTLALAAFWAPPLVSESQAQTSRDAGTALGVRVVSGQVQVYPAKQVRVSSASPGMTFTLQTPGYHFNNGSIDFGDWKDYFRCSAYDNGHAIRCTRLNNAPAGEASYTVSVDADNGDSPEQSPPNGVIMND